MPLIQKLFRNYWERGTAEYFQEKYRTTDPERLVPKLISVAARNASLLGGVTGAAMSTNELAGLFTAGEGGFGIPANLAIAGASIAGEAIALTHFQLKLVANIGKAYCVPLDPDDPEDILTIIAFAMGGGAAEAAEKVGMKVGGRLAGQAVKGVIRKEVLATLKKVGARVGVKILQRNLVKYTVPLASVFIGTASNYTSTRSIGKLAIRHFKQRLNDVPPAGDDLGVDHPSETAPKSPPANCT